MNSYQISGLTVASEVALPGVLDAPADADTPDVVIRLGDVAETLDGATTLGPCWHLAGDRFLLHIPGVARFLLTGGREIIVAPQDGSMPADIAVFLIGTVLGILLHQRGRSVLHASGVRVGAKAVLFCGPSGAGKSTLAAALSQEGFPVVTDDVCAVQFGAGMPPTAQPDGRQLKLWAHAIDNLALEERRGDALRGRLEKYYVEPPEVAPAPLPLGAVYVLREARPPLEAGIDRPNIVDAALLLKRNAYRPLLVRRMGQDAEYFRAATAIADTAGIFYLTRRLNFAEMPDVIRRLKSHWADIGLLEAAD